ncbi:MAG: DAK2 domain-containing protein [Syntrophomonadaceae bacterium]|nr:DAK2 domain-containing protein [Syntrophomonadaceae bacterium]
MSLTYITGSDLVRSVKSGCINLEHNRDSVDLLNVFPVPDGDTGTNMYLTLLSAVKEGEKVQDKPLGKVARAISMGSLMGARGNSGVILSQIFRGMARVLEGKNEANAIDIAMALMAGSDTAYEAVMKPVEGTILTVVREVAKACEEEARKNGDIVAVLLAGIKAGHITLDKTPMMLPILKEAGVVDAGGKGLLFFLEGTVQGLALEKDIELSSYEPDRVDQTSDRTGMVSLELEFQYCTEVLVRGPGLDVADMRDHLAPLGDSMLVVGDEEIVKVHIHSNHPGKVLETCLQWGQLTDIKINNMLEEAHERLLNMESPGDATNNHKKIGLVAVAVGAGLVTILKSLGVDIVVEGGQTMNPSTQDLLEACNQVNADAVILLPNNGNIVMAAEQVVQLADKQVVVIPTRSIMQAIAALMSYQPEGQLHEVVQNMTEQYGEVKYAEVTHAVRDSTMNGLHIKEGDIIGLIEDKIELATDSITETVKQLLKKIVNEDTSLITLYYGEEMEVSQVEAMKAELEEIYAECEVELYWGGQPHYNYFISIE